MITVAIERDAEDAREWIEAAKPTHPSLIDTDHVLADLYHMVNVPTVLWIDEHGVIVRPNDVVFSSDRFDQIAGVKNAEQMAALRAWVHDETQPANAQSLQTLPSENDQRARALFGLGNWLWQQGRTEAGIRLFAEAGALAPHDFMIRRGTMKMRDADPFGDEFRAMAQEWVAAGNRYYHPLPLD